MGEYIEYCMYDVEKYYKNPYSSLANGLSTTDEINVHEVNNEENFILKNSLAHSELIKV